MAKPSDNCKQLGSTPVSLKRHYKSPQNSDIDITSCNLSLIEGTDMTDSTIIYPVNKQLKTSSDNSNMDILAEITSMRNDFKNFAANQDANIRAIIKDELTNVLSTAAVEQKIKDVAVSEINKAVAPIAAAVDSVDNIAKTLQADNVATNARIQSIEDRLEQEEQNKRKSVRIQTKWSDTIGDNVTTQVRQFITDVLQATHLADAITECYRVGRPASYAAAASSSQQPIHEPMVVETAMVPTHGISAGASTSASSGAVAPTTSVTNTVRRAICVTFSSVNAKLEFIKLSREKTVFRGPNLVYINDDLTATRLAVFKAALSQKKQKVITDVRVNLGVIRIIRNDKTVHKISNATECAVFLRNL